MGRIKSLMVKRAARQLLEDPTIKFDGTFKQNKRILGNTLPSKPIRNKVAGYIARLIRMKQSPRVVHKPLAARQEEIEA